MNDRTGKAAAVIHAKANGSILCTESGSNVHTQKNQEGYPERGIPLIVSKESFRPAVPHKKRPAALWLLAVIYILSPSFWRGAGPFGKGPSPLLFALCYALPAR